LSGRNTLAYWINFEVMQKMKQCECSPWVTFATMHFVCNLQIGLISWSVKLEEAGNGYQRETLVY
jgi:hypothetical protein